MDWAVDELEHAFALLGRANTEHAAGGVAGSCRDGGPGGAAESYALHAAKRYAALSNVHDLDAIGALL